MSLATYATNPLWQVVDGPYRLTSFDSSTGAFTMSPNTSYGGPHAAKISILQAVPFTSGRPRSTRCGPAASMSGTCHWTTSIR